MFHVNRQLVNSSLLRLYHLERGRELIFLFWYQFNVVLLAIVIHNLMIMATVFEIEISKSTC